MAGCLLGALCVPLGAAGTGSAAEAQGLGPQADTRLEERIRPRLAWDKDLARSLHGVQRVRTEIEAARP